jgi:hypothetical protein
MSRYLAGVLLILYILFSLSCGSSRELTSISVSPATADAQKFPQGQVQFTATGTFNKAPTTVTPLSVNWCPQATCGVGTPALVGIIVDSDGLAQCQPGFAGTVTLVAEAPRNPGATVTPMSGMNAMVSGTAQMSCP